MIGLEEAQARIIAMGQVLPAETIPIGEADGRWTAEPAVALRTQPARDVSAMDGYAIAGGTTGPWRVLGESAAGASFTGPVGSDETVRIFTGAALPEGTNAIIIQENARIEDGQLSATTSPEGMHVRAAGSDFALGEVLVEAGTQLTAAGLALAATGGHGTLNVRRAPRVALLATGNELVPAGAPTSDETLPESNSLMVTSLVRQLGADAFSLGIIPDELPSIIAAIQSIDADLLITSGGASVGDYDLILPALQSCGANMDFIKVAMRPGKPIMAGRVGRLLVVGLPGNPVSAYVTTLLFVMPLVRAMLGAREPLPGLEVATLGTPLPANGPRTDHIRATIGARGVTPAGANDSAALRSLARADCLIRRAPNAAAAAVGQEVEIIRLN